MHFKKTGLEPVFYFKINFNFQSVTNKRNIFCCLIINYSWLTKAIIMKLILLILSFITFFNSVTAQLTVNFGVKGGANFSTFIGSEAGTANSLTSPYAGGFAQFSAGNNEDGFIRYAFLGELFYSGQGAKSNDEEIKLSYINLPIVVQRYFGGSGFYLETGPQIGFLISAKDKIGGETTDVKSDYKKTDFSLLGGLGYKFQNGLGINARYTLGLGSLDGSDTHNAMLSAGLFYVFGSRQY